MSYQWPSDGYQPDNTPSFDTPNIAPPEDVLSSISYDQGNYNELPSFTGSSFDYSDVTAGVTMALSGSWDGPDMSSPALQSGSSTANGLSATSDKRQGVPTPVGGNEESWWKQAMKFSQDPKNTQLMKSGMSMLVGLSQESSKRKSEAGLYAARMNEIKVKDQLEQDANKRFSSSITGLRPVGLINSRQPLRRGNGSNVFTANGTMNTTGQ